MEDTVRARGVRVRLLSPDEPVHEAYLDAEGCITFESRHVYGLKLLVYAESYVGDQHNVHIRAFDNRPNAVQAQEAEIAAAEDAAEAGKEVAPGIGNTFLPAPWELDLLEVPVDNLDNPTLAAIVPPDDLTRMLGWTIEAFHRVDAHAGIEGPQELLLHTENLDPDASLGAYVLDDFMMLGPLARVSKFIVAHELGHWYQEHWSDRHISTSYLYGLKLAPQPDDRTVVYAKNAPCDFTFAPVLDEQINDLHGIRSAEWADAAMGEGFAHFFAALAFNRPTDPGGAGEFRYYKAVDGTTHPDYQDMIDDNYIVDLIGSETARGGPSAWVPNMCPYDWDTPLSGYAYSLSEDENGVFPGFLGNQVSSEIDWLRMFWGFMADPDPTLPSTPPLPDLRTILGIFKANNSLRSKDIYADFQAVLDNPTNIALYPYRERFTAAAAKNGIATNE